MLIYYLLLSLFGTINSGYCVQPPSCSVELVEEAVVEPIPEYDVVATVYNAYDPSQGWGDGSVTASGKEIDSTLLRLGHIRYIAISRDLRDRFKFGDSVYVDIPDKPSISGVYQVEDLMAKRWTNRIDILTYDMKLGKWNAKIRKHE